ncbi:hypothetical protein AB0M34_09435 [Nocardia sp. NPDC050193]
MGSRPATLLGQLERQRRVATRQAELAVDRAVVTATATSVVCTARAATGGRRAAVRSEP